jgi:hypothetical protein
LLQVQTLRKYPELAQAIGDAVAAIRAKKDPTVPLTAARQAIEGNIGALSTLPVWSGAW